MKYTTSIVGFMLALNGVMAAPVPEPAVKVVVVTKDVVQTVQYTSTVWVPPSGPAPTDSANDNNDSENYKNRDKKKHKPSKSDLPTDALSSVIESAMTTDLYSTSLPTPTTTASESSETETSTTEEDTSTTETPTSTEVPTTTQAPTTTAEPTTISATLSLTASSLAALPSKVISTLDKATGGLLPNVGEATFYATGLGSCGMTNTDSDLIAAISYVRMDAVNSGNTNNNPLCGKQVKATYNGGPPVVITIVDRCPACGPDDLDLSPEAFKQLGAHPDDGRVKFSWDWL